MNRQMNENQGLSNVFSFYFCECEKYVIGDNCLRVAGGGKRVNHITRAVTNRTKRNNHRLKYTWVCIPDKEMNRMQMLSENKATVVVSSERLGNLLTCLK